MAQYNEELSPTLPPTTAPMFGKIGVSLIPSLIVLKSCKEIKKGIEALKFGYLSLVVICV